MTRGIPHQFVRVCLGFLLGASFFLTNAQAAHVDPAPLPPEVVNRVVRDGAPDPLFQSLEQSLDETVDIVKHADGTHPHGVQVLNNASSMLLDSKRHELDSYLAEIRRRLDQQGAQFSALGLPNPTGKIRAQIEARFKRVTQALERIRQATDSTQGATAVAAARKVLREVYELPKQARLPKIVANGPTWKSEAPRPSQDGSGANIPQG